MTTLLEARRVTRIFGGGLFGRRSTLALEDFSLAIDGDRPSIIAVVGESGSGKTTLGRLLLGLTVPTRGQVLYKGQNLQKMSGADWRAFRRDVQATAYQISDTIVVLYRGSVAEAGDVELVVKQSQHPYTQLLVSSIPLASPERTWMTTHATVPAGPQGATDTGCKFAVRCLFVEPPCRETAPPLFQTDRRRAVSCYLYRGAPTLAADAMGHALTAPTASAQPGRTGVTRTP